MHVLYLNSTINHCVRKIILTDCLFIILPSIFYNTHIVAIDTLDTHTRMKYIQILKLKKKINQN